MAETPLTRSYDLVVLKPQPGTGRLELSGHPLFPIGARRADRVEVAFRCESSDWSGVAFAVVAWEGRSPHLISIHTAKISPGRYEMSAELRAPGRVRFHGLPGLREDRRDWRALVGSVPAHLESPPAPAHLICAIEMCGGPEKVGERVARAERMIREMSNRLPGLLRASLLTYAAHSFDPKVKEVPIQVPAWQADPGRVLDALAGLDRTGSRRGYPDGAQLEDMLAEVLKRLGAERDERTALLIIGGRSPHPPAARSHILPCPSEHDWEALLHRFERRQKARIGVICDYPPDQAGPTWSRLGRTALAHLDAVDFTSLGVELGVAARDQRINFPLID
jgi:hypothetical protein